MSAWRSPRLSFFGMQDLSDQLSVQPFGQLYLTVVRWAAGKEIKVLDRELPDNQAGEFDGLSVMMNNSFGVEERSYYLLHALGSIICWSLDSTVDEMFDNLRAKKKSKDADPAGFEAALARYRSFETTSSEYAVGLLIDLGYRDVVRSYSNFMRADLESMTQFHRHGQLAPWHDFFAAWNREVASGRRAVTPFRARPVPSFRARQISLQTIMQRRDDDRWEA